MAQLHETIANFLTDLTAHLRESLVTPDQEFSVSWREPDADADAVESEPASELVWWSCTVSIDDGCRIWCGAPLETWQELQRAHESATGQSEGDQSEAGQFAALAQAVVQAAQQRFGSQVSCAEEESPEEPAPGAAAALIEISTPERSFPALKIALSAEMVSALGVPEAEPEHDWRNNPVERLLHVEVPVSVLLGRAKLRMKDVLALSGGSVVELEQELRDDVEIRVNNCVIARGEMVAVDGNYGVRIVEMVSGQNGTNGIGRMV